MATDGKRKGKLNIPQLKDANLAANSGDCTLILTVGYSAKSFAMSGLSVVGQDKYGVFPLKGNLLNVRKTSPQRAQRNAKIQEIKNILGLQDGKTYENVKELRYGHLLIMATDQPKITLCKCAEHQLLRPNKKTNEVLSFYTMPEYEAWKEKLGNKATEYKIKYHKQLETFEREEVKEYFADLDHHIENFGLVDDKDGDVIELAYGKNIEARKEWLQAPDKEKYPLAEKRAPAKRAPDAAGPQRANKKSRMWVSDSDEEEPEDVNDVTEDSDFEDEE
ncbi:topoisomerase II [Artemisia annua]|uniref:DNA topoisomerase (ATP-hydrolyzing) n=1 Tax=Artemisia annua TaxID=35608 RepID=A0A2U1QN66_ARTAN|nr:topoisomerase II [Artemisia annua]